MQAGSKPLRVAVLMNVIAPYHKPLLERLTNRFAELQVLLSTPMEANRAWKVDWSGLQVSVQRNITIRKIWRHPDGFSEPLYVHVPVDTVMQLRRMRPDLVISWEMGMRTILSAFYCAVSRTKLMVWAEFAESTEYGRGRMRQVLRRALHRAVDGFLVTGESGARYLRAIGVAERKLHKIVYTTDVERFATAGARRCAEAERKLLYVGQLSERKGLLPFLRVAAEWARDHPSVAIDFTLIGEGPLRTALEGFATPPNFRLFFFGDVNYEHLPAVYAKAGIFVFPTLADTWGVVVNEALAAGLPVLGSVNGQAVAELVQDGRNGWSFSPGDFQEMRRAFDCAMNVSDSELACMRERARETALRVTPDDLANSVERAVVACVEQGGWP